MYNIVFYEDKNGFSELNDELMEENNYENMGRFQKGC